MAAGEADIAQLAETKQLVINKLRNEWSSHSLASLLTPQLLQSVLRVFGDLTHDIQARVLMALLCLPDPIPSDKIVLARELVTRAANTPATDEWVPLVAAMVAENRPDLASEDTKRAFSTYVDESARQALQFLLPIEQATKAEHRKLDPLSVPREYLYMSKDALPSVQIASPEPDFTLDKSALPAPSPPRASAPPAPGRHTGLQAHGTPRVPVKRDRPAGGSLAHLMQDSRKHKKTKVKSMDSITANTSSAATTKVTKGTGAAGAGTVAGAAATAAYPPGKEWKADAQKQFKKYSVAMLKERDWLRYKAFKRREPNPNPAKPEHKFVLCRDPESREHVIVVKLDYKTYKDSLVRVKLKRK